MTLDLSNPDHEAALLRACGVARSQVAQLNRDYVQMAALGASDPIDKAALLALSSPASTAELIRQLVERAGVRVIPANKSVVGPSATVIHDGFGGLVVEMSSATIPGAAHDCAIPGKRIASTIARLLALAPNAGAEAVLRALRGKT